MLVNVFNFCNNGLICFRLTFSSAEKEQAATPKQQVNVNKEMDVEEDFDDTLTENTE